MFAAIVTPTIDDYSSANHVPRCGGRSSHEGKRATQKFPAYGAWSSRLLNVLNIVSTFDRGPETLVCQAVTDRSLHHMSHSERTEAGKYFD